MRLHRRSTHATNMELAPPPTLGAKIEGRMRDPRWRPSIGGKVEQHKSAAAYRQIFSGPLATLAAKLGAAFGVGIGMLALAGCGGSGVGASQGPEAQPPVSTQPTPSSPPVVEPPPPPLPPPVVAPPDPPPSPEPPPPEPPLPPSPDPPPAINTAPTIGGQPARAVIIGQLYRFTPSAADAEGNALSFSVENLPAWATFDPASGTIQGRPGLNDLGMFANVRIEVSDGEFAVALAPFTIEVTAVGDHSAELSWIPPTENTDGSPLTDLAGYRVCRDVDVDPDCGNSELHLNPGLTRLVIDNLPAGDNRFALNAINAASVESERSNVASKIIP